MDCSAIKRYCGYDWNCFMDKLQETDCFTIDGSRNKSCLLAHLRNNYFELKIPKDLIEELTEPPPEPEQTPELAGWRQTKSYEYLDYPTEDELYPEIQQKQLPNFSVGHDGLSGNPGMVIGRQNVATKRIFFPPGYPNIIDNLQPFLQSVPTRLQEVRGRLLNFLGPFNLLPPGSNLNGNSVDDEKPINEDEDYDDYKDDDTDYDDDEDEDLYGTKTTKRPEIADNKDVHKTPPKGVSSDKSMIKTGKTTGKPVSKSRINNKYRGGI